MNAEPRRQPVSDIGADHPDDNVANDPHSVFRHELRGDPSRDEAHRQNDGEALIGQMQGGKMHAVSNVLDHITPTQTQNGPSLRPRLGPLRGVWS